MTGIQEVLSRIEEIQSMMKSVQAPMLKRFQQMQELKAGKFKETMNNSINKQSNISENQNLTKAENTNSIERLKNTIPTNHFSSNQDFSPIIKEASEKFGVPQSLIKAVIQQESSYNPRAVSWAGAKGLMQLMPQTANAYGVKDIFDPKQNVFAGTKHLRDLLEYFNGDLKLTLASYNAGIKRVLQSGGVPNINETQNYVRNVIGIYQNLEKNK